MKAITLKHPWPFAICCLGKRIENRSWKPSPGQLRPGDWLAIHGGAIPKGVDRFDAELDLGRLRLGGLAPADAALDDVMLPGIVAVCRFGGTVTDSADPWFAGPFGWLLDDLAVLPEPVPCGGAQGLWEVIPDVLDEVRARWRALQKATAPP